MGGSERGKLDDGPSEANRPTAASRRRFLRLFVASAAGATGLAGAGSAQEAVVVAMGDTYFDPIGLHVRPGATIRFEIETGTHSATAYSDRIPAGAAPFDSGTISAGGFDHTFDTPGTYDYYCIPHRAMGMVGRVVVGEPGGPAEASSIPDGAVPASETIVERGAVPVEALDGAGGDVRAGPMGSMSGQPMGPRFGMTNGRGPGWMALMPIGFSTAVLGLAVGVAYWASRRGTTGSTGDDSAMATLRERYARGEIDAEEYADRERRLQRRGRNEG